MLIKYGLQFAVLSSVVSSIALAQSPPPPPAKGSNTSGVAAVAAKTDEEENTKVNRNSLLGHTKVKEFRYQNGRVQRIEFEHTSGSKQVIEENDSDGKIESRSNDIEETPNLPKWVIGSW